jgi:hypothetical protein
MLAQENPLFARLEGHGCPWEDIRLVREGAPPPCFGSGPGAWQRSDGNAGEGLDLFLVDWTFGTEELPGYSEPSRRVEPHPTLLMHSDDAARWGLANGDRVAIHLEKAVMEADLVLARNMARGTLFLPRHRRLDWQKLSALRVRIPIGGLRKR